MTKMHHIRQGQGPPLLLIHGLGGSWRSWWPVLGALAAEREVIAVDLPGFGETPPLIGEVSIRTLADAMTTFLTEKNLLGVDAVGSSMAARLVLELARRGGVLGSVVSLDPGGFWDGWQRHAFYSSIWASVRLVRLLQPIMPALTRHVVTRTLLFAQFSAHPWRLSPQVLLSEMRSYAASLSFDELLRQLAYGETQQGATPGLLEHPVLIGWGRRDGVCFPSQARRAMRLFPEARFHWFNRCGHFPQWDVPEETVRVILAHSGQSMSSSKRATASQRRTVSGNSAYADFSHPS
jgi:pimeloyl-ACP methyl ester carboxylesterase